MAKIVYKTSNKEVEIEEGQETNILKMSMRHDAGIPFKCGGGICGTCEVKIVEGEEHVTEPKKKEIKRLGDKLEKGYRLACQTFATDDCMVEWEEK
jgi:ferredoxin